MRKVGAGTEKFTVLRACEEFVADSLSCGVADGAEKDHGCGFWRWAVLGFVGKQGGAEDGISSGAGSDHHDTFGINS